MATSIQVAGACLIKVGTGSAGALETLGYTRDGATIRLDGYFLDVKTDDAGGEAGPPADVQWLGQTAMIGLELTRWDDAIAEKFVNRVFGQTTAGSITVANAPTGSLMITGSFGHRLCLIPSVGRAYNFPYAFFREAIEVNKGTKYSTMRVESYALAVSNGTTSLLFNNSTS
jgi:hypothetical protein